MSRAERYQRNFKGHVMALRAQLHLANRLSYALAVPEFAALDAAREILGGSIRELEAEKINLDRESRREGA